MNELEPKDWKKFALVLVIVLCIFIGLIHLMHAANEYDPHVVAGGAVVLLILISLTVAATWLFMQSRHKEEKIREQVQSFYEENRNAVDSAVDRTARAIETRASTTISNLEQEAKRIIQEMVQEIEKIDRTSNDIEDVLNQAEDSYRRALKWLSKSTFSKQKKRQWKNEVRRQCEEAITRTLRERT